MICFGMLKRFPTNIRDVERALAEVTNLAGTLALRVPTHAKHLGPCGESSLLQFITTWATRQDRPILQTYVANSQDPQISEFVRHQYGLAAAILCAAAKAKSLSVDITAEVKSAAISQLLTSSVDALDSARVYDQGLVVAEERSSRGRAAEIMCVDHLDIQNKIPFYVTDHDGYRKLRDLKGFTQLTNRVFERLIPSYYRRSFSSEFKNAIGAFAFELVGNTHDHARTGLDGRELELSLRGLYARHYELPGKQLVATAGDFDPMKTYFGSLSAARRTRAQLVELSIYDCGPGMAQRWTGRPLDELPEAEELQAVQECFKEGASTKHHRMFGGGLPLVLGLLREHNGFLRLRTGRLSLFWSANRCGTSAESALAQWLPPNLQRLSPVTGTLVTVLAPVPAETP